MAAHTVTIGEWRSFSILRCGFVGQFCLLTWSGVSRRDCRALPTFSSFLMTLVVPTSIVEAVSSNIGIHFLIMQIIATTFPKTHYRLTCAPCPSQIETLFWDPVLYCVTLKRTEQTQCFEDKVIRVWYYRSLFLIFLSFLTTSLRRQIWNTQSFFFKGNFKTNRVNYFTALTY